MAEIKFIIPTEKLAKVLDGFEALYPIPLDDEGSPLHTKAEWARKKVKEYIVSTVARGERLLAVNAAKAAVVEDETMTD